MEAKKNNTTADPKMGDRARQPATTSIGDDLRDRLAEANSVVGGDTPRPWTWSQAVGPRRRLMVIPSSTPRCVIRRSGVLDVHGRD
jgi:hypothetical protein